MVLLEYLRGGSGASLSGSVIDDIKAKATKIEEETSFKGSRRSVVLLKVPGIDVDKSLSYEDAHQYSKACVPRRVYELDENGAHATNETGEKIQRLRQPGDKGTHKLYSYLRGNEVTQSFIRFWRRRWIILLTTPSAFYSLCSLVCPKLTRDDV